ncbi:D-alanyl-D-alanine carboxypeptidase/D-alanyl-D-alanine-endopeptidase [candidate division KSB1 bacterium]|nr:D-alanyl-D-alanine carboxypeptidase/D-alanyl-D-alanine-endopeptidase [candidate division KSB1 bacterium]
MKLITKLPNYLITKLPLIPLLPVLLFMFTGCAGTYQSSFKPSANEQLAKQIDQQISIPELETALVGIMVKSAETGEIFYQHNANTLMMPASNEKIPTSAATLLKFGPDFRYQTKIITNGSIEKGVLNGDLIVVGSGDPTISSRFCDNPDSCFIFQSWADSLKSKGIEKINGNIIGVDDVFDDELIGYGWTVDNLPYSYSAQISGLSFNENYATVKINADSTGDKINISVIPDFDYLEIESQLTINEDESDIGFDRVLNTNRLKIFGTIKPGSNYTQKVSIHNPTKYFVSALKKELQQLGIEVSGETFDADELRVENADTSSNLLFTHSSIPMKEVLKILMKESQNLYAESFVKLLGAYFGKEGSFEEGEKILKQTLQRLGLEKDSYAFKDGSGLCRYNYISPAHLVKILRRMYFHPYGKIWRDCLPIAGVDGTIDYRLKRTVAQNNIFAKTGTISNVRCLSGYAKTKDGETLVFSTMFNNFLCSTQVVMDVQDQICMLLASFKRL